MDISWQTQRILMFIPIINMFNFFAWLIRCKVYNVPFKTFFKSVLMLMGCVLVVGLACVELSAVFPSFEALFYKLGMYFLPFSISLVLLIYQKKIGMDF